MFWGGPVWDTSPGFLLGFMVFFLGFLMGFLCFSGDFLMLGLKVAFGEFFSRVLKQIQDRFVACLEIP